MGPLLFRICITASAALLAIRIIRTLPNFSFRRYFKEVISQRHSPAHKWSSLFNAIVMVTILALLREYTPLIKYTRPATYEIIGSVLLLAVSTYILFQPEGNPATETYGMQDMTEDEG